VQFGVGVDIPYRLPIYMPTLRCIYVYVYIYIYIYIYIRVCVCVCARARACFNYLHGANAKLCGFGAIFDILIENRISCNAFLTHNNYNNNKPVLLGEKNVTLPVIATQ